jgi:hypothetical protein
VASVAAGGANVLTVTSLTVAAAGRLNLNNNELVVDYAPLAGSPIAGIRALLTSGYHNGAWDGNGIMSGSGDASKFALGFAEASDVGGIAGLGLDGTAVVVKFALYGDANLDGKVDFLDLAKLAQSYNATLPAQQGSWDRGDFSYDGAVDFLDLAKLAQQYNTSLPGAANLASAAQSLSPVTVQAARPVAALVVHRPVRRHDRHDRR